MRIILGITVAALLAAGCAQPSDPAATRADARVATGDSTTVPLLPGLPGAVAEDCDDCVSEAVPLTALPASEAAWKAKLTTAQFTILRRGGTERAYTGEYLKHWEDGVYHCAGCDNPLYDSKTKYDSCGWPSFWDAIPGGIAQSDDGASAPELICKRCEGHLGHLFSDGPKPTGLRH